MTVTAPDLLDGDEEPGEEHDQQPADLPALRPPHQPASQPAGLRLEQEGPERGGDGQGGRHHHGGQQVPVNR